MKATLMINSSYQRYGVHPRHLSNAQRQAHSAIKQKLKFFANRTQVAYARLWSTFLGLSGFCLTTFEDIQSLRITRAVWQTFETELARRVRDKKQQTCICHQVRQAVLAIVRDADIPALRKAYANRASGRKSAVITLPKTAFSDLDDLRFIAELENSRRQFRADNFRRFCGRIASADKSVFERPLKERFSRAHLLPVLDQVLAPLTHYAQFQSFFLIGRDLDRFFHCQDFGWLEGELLTRSAKFKPVWPCTNKSVPSIPGLLEAQDFRKDPLLAVLDKAVPTNETAYTRRGRVAVVQATSRRMYTTDLMHLLNARMVHSIGQPSDAVEDWFTQQSTDALITYLKPRMQGRTIAKTLRRLRSLYVRLSFKNDSKSYHYMLVNGRKIFKHNPAKRKRLDHIDDPLLENVIKAELGQVCERLKAKAHSVLSYEILELRDLLIVAMLLKTAIRHKNMKNLRFSQIIRIGAKASIKIPASEVKNKVELNIPLPDWLVPALDKYRSLLPQHVQKSDIVWFSRDHARLSGDRIRDVVASYSICRINTRLTPHDLRRLASKRDQLNDDGRVDTAQARLGHRTGKNAFGPYGTNLRPDHLEDLFAVI